MAWTKAPEQERRAQILAAALHTAAHGGLARLTLRAVATEAGLSHGLVLFHFGSKDALLEALLDEVLAWLLTRSPSVSSADDLVSVLRAEITDADPVHMAVLLDFWVLGTRTPALRDRLRRAVGDYEKLLTPPAGPDAARGSPHELAALGAVVVFGSALRALLDDGPPDGAVTTLARLLRADAAAGS